MTQENAHQSSEHKSSHQQHPQESHEGHSETTQKGHGGHGGGKGHQGHQGGDHHAHMVADFRKRFWISLGLTVPMLVLSPMIQSFLGLTAVLGFPGDAYLLWGLASAVFFYGGWPFLKGLFDELEKKQPGMMTLIAIAIATAYGYSSVVVFGLSGKVFFWELATLIDIMLLGHWI
ncbi:MAG: heavy metal translocating P-type ATPase, partial [Desulfobacteraceae bacterium]